MKRDRIAGTISVLYLAWLALYDIAWVSALASLN